VSTIRKRYSNCGVLSWPWQLFELGKADRALFVTIGRCIPVDNTFGCSAVVFWAREIIPLFCTVFRGVRAVHKFDCRLAMNETLTRRRPVNKRSCDDRDSCFLKGLYVFPRLSFRLLNGVKISCVLFSRGQCYTKRHGATSQKAWEFINSAVRTSTYCSCKAPHTLSVKLGDFNVWRHTWRKNWVNCAVLTGNSLDLRTVLYNRLSHRELHSSLRESHSFLSLPADTTMAPPQGTQFIQYINIAWYIPFQIPLLTSHFTLSFLLLFTLSVKLSDVTVWRIPGGQTEWTAQAIAQASELSFTGVFHTENCAVHSGNPTVSSVYLPTPRWTHLKAHPFLATHSADGHLTMYSFSDTTSYSTFYAFFSSFRITLWPMWLANSKRQPCFYPP